MTEEFKKNVFGSFNKKTIEEVVETLTNELAIAKSDMIQQSRNTEQTLNEYKTKLTNFEAEINIKNNLVIQLKRRIEEQDKEIQILNHKLGDSNSGAVAYNAHLNQMGEVCAFAYESAMKMANEAQKGAEEFVSVICGRIDEARDELANLKSSSVETKMNIAKKIDQLKNQFILLQDQFLYIADEESAMAEMSARLEDLKHRTVSSIKGELAGFASKYQKYSQQPVTLRPETDNIRPAESANLGSANVFNAATVNTNTKIVETAASSDSASENRSAPYEFNPIFNPKRTVSDSMLDFERIINGDSENNQTKQIPVIEPASLSEAEAQKAKDKLNEIPKGSAPQYSNLKSPSVKDILKKYSNPG